MYMSGGQTSRERDETPKEIEIAQANAVLNLYLDVDNMPFVATITIGSVDNAGDRYGEVRETPVDWSRHGEQILYEREIVIRLQLPKIEMEEKGSLAGPRNLLGLIGREGIERHQLKKKRE
ncbi:hypothetical protein TorRG33x02_116740 [Trema orientale]|uniref:Uncharacterized protein n=1 Tax=Trema orientale TaxID=63057 RepID=A0A2P5F450_TREOI|nr:hypothetical protein TorRG33x02_116740 [Trema orientale]